MEEQLSGERKARPGRHRKRGGRNANGNGSDAGQISEVITPEEAARLEEERKAALENIMEEIGGKKGRDKSPEQKPQNPREEKADPEGEQGSGNPGDRRNERSGEQRPEKREEKKPEKHEDKKSEKREDRKSEKREDKKPEKREEKKAEKREEKKEGKKEGKGGAPEPMDAFRGGKKTVSLKEHFYSGLSLFIALALAILFYYLLSLMPQILKGLSGFVRIIMPFIYGAVFAYLLVPVCNYAERGIRKVFRLKEGTGLYRAARPIGVVFSFVFALLMIGVLMLLVIPQVWTAVNDIMEVAPKNYERLVKAVTKFFASYPQIVEWISKYSDDVYNYGYNFLQTKILPNLAQYMGGISNGVLTAVTGVLNVVVGLIVSVYLLLSRGRFLTQAKMILYSVFKKPIADKVCEEASFADDTFSGYINGKVIDSILVGVVAAVGAAIMKVPYPILMGVVIGITNMIPIFGPFIGMVPCTIIILLIDPIKAIYYIIFNIILQQVEGNILAPLILGDSTGLSGFWVLFAITVFGGWWGFMGMIIGVPIFAVIYHLIRQAVQYGLIKKGQKVLLIDYTKEYNPDRKKKKSLFSFRRKKETE